MAGKGNGTRSHSVVDLPGSGASLTLEQYLFTRPDQTPRTLREVRHRLELFLAIVDAVGALREHGVTHADITPRGILVVRDEFGFLPRIRLRDSGLLAVRGDAPGDAGGVNTCTRSALCCIAS